MSTNYIYLIMCLGKYFELIGIKASSRDIVGNGRFLPYPQQDNNSPEHKYLNSLIWKHIYNPIKKVQRIRLLNLIKNSINYYNTSKKVEKMYFNVV